MHRRPMNVPVDFYKKKTMMFTFQIDFYRFVSFTFCSFVDIDKVTDTFPFDDFFVGKRLRFNRTAFGSSVFVVVVICFVAKSNNRLLLLDVGVALFVTKHIDIIQSFSCPLDCHLIILLVGESDLSFFV